MKSSGGVSLASALAAERRAVERLKAVARGERPRWDYRPAVAALRAARTKVRNLMERGT